MNFRKTYTSLRTANLAEAENWYTKLFGRGPDYRPMKTLVQWELSEHSGLMVSADVDIAANGAVFIVVEDVAAERRRLQSVGISLGKDMQGDYSTLAQVRDPDGNLLTLATPPSRRYPRA